MLGKAFVRKFPRGDRTNRTDKPVTMVLLLVDGDVTSLTAEAMHALHIIDDDGLLTINVLKAQQGCCDRHPEGPPKGLTTDQILTHM